VSFVRSAGPRAPRKPVSLAASLSNNLRPGNGVSRPPSGAAAGRARHSADGHQFHRPISTAVAGTSSVLTRNVSISTPSARPTPTFTIVRTFCAPALPEPTIASTPNVPASTSPAEVTVVPVTLSARPTASRSGSLQASSLMRVMTRML
jgi:hypothetical protein